MIKEINKKNKKNKKTILIGIVLISTFILVSILVEKFELAIYGTILLLLSIELMFIGIAIIWNEVIEKFEYKVNNIN